MNLMCVTWAPLFSSFQYNVHPLPHCVLFFPSYVLLQLSIQARSEVIKRATKALRQLGEKSRKRGGNGGGEQEGKDPAEMTFDEALEHLQQSQAHLDTLNHAFILSLKDSQQVDPSCLTLNAFYFLRAKSPLSVYKCWLKVHTKFNNDFSCC